jgi:hypothetical protein
MISVWIPEENNTATRKKSEPISQNHLTFYIQSTIASMYPYGFRNFELS